MMKLKLTPVMPVGAYAKNVALLLTSVFLLIPWVLKSQCTPANGTISGIVYLEENFDGTRDFGEPGLGNVMVSAYNTIGQKVGEDIASPDGSYSISGLTNGYNYRVEFSAPNGYLPTMVGATSKELTQFVQVPSCDASLGLQIPSDYCEENPMVGLSCFARGAYDLNSDMETLVGLNYDFNLNSPVTKYAAKSETGSVWGVAWKKGTQTLYSSAFVKQYVALSPHGLGAIFQSKFSRTGEIHNSLFVNLRSLGIDVGTLPVTDPNHCDYGSQALKMGLGALVISADEKYLYAVNIHNNSIVRVSTSNPNDGTHQEHLIDFDGCEDDEFRAFAMVEHEGSYYVGITCTAETAKDPQKSAGHVLKYDPELGTFDVIFSTNYLKGFWADQPSNRLITSHLLTDIAFTDQGNMVIGLADRVGHRFCNGAAGRTDQQFPDILMVWNDNGTWRLENNGRAGSLVGTGVGNGEGPGGGEFFGDDYWITNPTLHPEIALGSVLTFPGKGDVIASVYDPYKEAYSGGLHRYSTTNGQLTARKELYQRDFTSFLGKATGFGDMVPLCGEIPIEIGNKVWEDIDNDGEQDPGEPGFAGLEISLYNTNCELVGQTVSDANGHYYFNDSNVDLNQDGEFDGLEFETNYYLVVSDGRFDKNTASLQVGGLNYVFAKPNSLDGENKDFIDSDAQIASNICPIINGSSYVEVTTGSSGVNNHTIDIGVTSDFIFDLALIKKTPKTTTVKVGEVVPFEIFVLNQGNLMAEEIVIDDHINLGYEFVEGMNPGWRSNGTFAKYKIPGKLYPGEMVSVPINLVISEFATKVGLMNIAEIASANDQFGNPGDDIDSTPDDDPLNDMEASPIPPGDNSFEDVGAQDEDDHDFEELRMFDLALIKILEYGDDKFVAGEEIPFLIRIFNQGSEVAKDVKIVDYFPMGMSFDVSKNAGWSVDSDQSIVYTLSDPLSPGDVAEVKLKMDILNNFAGSRLVNYAEIASAASPVEAFPTDFDSKANQILGDDAGGEPGTIYDNEIFLRIEDEDDHDGEQVYVDQFDLALYKSSDVNLVNKGDEITFHIHVINQGSLTADNIKIVDYLPTDLILADPDWQLDPTDPTGKRVCYTLSSSSGTLSQLGLLPEDEVIIPITLQVALDASLGPLTNVAEIVEATDITGNDITDLDEDSNYDTDDSNDEVIDDEIDDDGQNDEDDHDPETIYVTQSGILSYCECLINANNAYDGQFEDQISVTAPTGQVWRIVSEEGVFDPSVSIDPPAAPVPYPDNHELDISPQGVMSSYSLNILHIDGQGYSIVIGNEDGDQRSFSSEGCTYDDPVILGPSGACDDSFIEYFVANPNPNYTYTWELTGGGVIHENFGDYIIVNWTDLGATGTLKLEVDGEDVCYAPAILDVTVGQTGGPISCTSHIQTSLDENCQLVVTADMVTTGELRENSVYSVMLTDEYGNPIPGAILTEEHIGQLISVKIIDDCGGNSCWGTIEVEDKIAPVIVCEDITINCWDMLSYTGPEVEENCTEYEIEILDEFSTNLGCEDDKHIKEHSRTYIATDKYGNVSNECTQKITLSRIDLSLVMFPDSFLISEDRALTCGAYPVDADGYPDVSATGVPTIEGRDMYPVTDLFCNVGVSYTDYDLPTTDCTRKVMRTWTVYEAWCTVGQLRQYVQLIEVEDNIPPHIYCPADITISSNGEICGANVFLPPATASDNCSTEFEFDVSYEGGFLNNQNGGTVYFEAGTHDVTYTVYDECLNSAYCTIEVTVVDETAPVAVCDQNTVVGLSLTGEAVVYAYAFDDGSYDDCYIDRMEVKRLFGQPPRPFCDPLDYLYGESVTFCCDDVGRDLMVMLAVWDQAGNSNECMVNVHVQDKHPPIINCPEDVTISCNSLYDLNDLSEFGNVTTYDQCSVDTTELVVPNINSCGTGYIDRIFTANDNNGSSTCTQRITIKNPSPFNFDNITPPEDFETEAACDAGDLDPDALDPPFDRPVLAEDECDLIGMNYRDFVFPFEDEANSCLKIVRRWTIIDWCQPLEEGGFRTWTRDQIIKVNNKVPPFIRLVVDIETCSFDEECEEGFVELEASATDDCTPGINLVWEAALDQDSDGSIDSTWMGTGSLADAAGYYPLGTHIIYFTFEDRCGNKVTDSAMFTIKNCKAPIVACIDGLAVGIEPMDTDGDGIADTEMAIICAEDFDASSMHPCGFPIKFTFDQECELPCIPVDCNDLGEQIVQIWVTDIFGNQAYCETTIVIQDTNDEEICEEVDDCIEWPEADITISDCVPDFDPATINSETVIDPDCICDTYEIEYDDTFGTDSEGCTEITRLWTVTFRCGLVKTFDYTQTIHILNSVAPVIDCPDNLSASAINGNCETDVSIPVPNVTAVCNSGFTITHNSVYADAPGEDASGTYPVGTTTVTFTVADICGNSTSCEVIVTVTDGTPPVCVSQNITIQLDPDGTVSITAAQINDGSFDDCGVIIDFDVTPKDFDCDDIGGNVVTLTVTDDSGNISNCTATVTIEDNIAPECVARNITIMLDDQGVATISAAELDGGSVDTCGMTDLTFDVNQDSFNCDDVGDVDVILTVTDEAGNSSTCEATVTVVDEVAPECRAKNITITLGDDGTVSITGADVDDGSFDLCGDILSLEVVPSDFDCSTIGNNTVTLTVTDESDNTSSCTAIVTVDDPLAPDCVPQDITIFLDDQGVASIVASDVDGGSSDVCGDGGVNVDIDRTNFTCADIGVVTVTLTVTDGNNNTSTCEAFVTVKDQEAPECLTQNLTIYLDEQGQASITADEIDNGSEDACGTIADLSLDKTDFDCSETGANTVTLTVTDDSGNASMCQATVTVIDSLPPICVVTDITLYLDEQGMATIDPDVVGDGSFDNCDVDVDLTVMPGDFFCNDAGTRGFVLIVTDDFGNSSSCEGSVTVLDTIPPDIICPMDLEIDCADPLDDLTLYGVATATDECSLNGQIAEVSVVDTDDCGLGTVVRTFTAVDNSGNVSQCSQIITITLGDDPVGLDDITAPPDTVFVEDCTSIDPADLPNSQPEVDLTDAACSNISIGFSDMSITGGNTCPDTILRVWTVIDTCQLVPGTQSGIFTFDQILVITDTNPPVLDIPGDMVLFLPPDTCSLFVNLPGTVTDCDLTPTVVNDSEFADDPNSADASGNYPDGVHIITVTATDACGNMNTGSYSLTLLDTIPPDFECIKIVANIEDDGMIDVPIGGIVSTLSDNCTDSLLMTISFSRDDPFDTIRTYDCSFLAGNVVRDDTTFVYAFDNSLNYDSCKTIITVSDIDGQFCGNNLVNVGGDVRTEYDEAISFVNVALEGSELDDAVTQDNGVYAFRNMPMGNSYTVRPEKDLDPLNGVSTLDIILIQKHILGVDRFDSPYKQIAADINNSRSITATDMVELRKLILGIYNDFPNNKSWRIIDRGYEFFDPTDAFIDLIPESHFIPVLDQSLDIDFIGVKTGDVNGSADPIAFNDSDVQIRSKPFAMDFEIQKVNKEGLIYVDVKAEDFKQVEGFQFTLTYPAMSLNYMAVESGSIEMTQNNVGVLTNRDGLLTFSWNDMEAVSAESDEILFSLVFSQDRNHIVHSSWDLNSDLTVAEIYQREGVKPVEARFIQTELNQKGYSLDQNAPNPWSELTEIKFYLPIDTEAELNIYDVTGKLVYSQKELYQAGYQTLAIRKQDLTANGVLYYELKTKDVNLVRKMLHIK